MAHLTNEFSESMLKIVGEFRDLHEKATKAKAIPFGMEKVSKKEFVARLETMSPIQREALLKDPATRDRVIEAIRGA
jgi:hypothetical protein